MTRPTPARTKPSIAPANYQDGLVCIDQNKTAGNHYLSKMLWALGNYSRFLRPGAVRRAAQLANSAGAARPLVPAYRSTIGKQLITVVVNDHDAPAATDLQPGPALLAGQPLRGAPRSVTTLVGELR